jgi:site-specific recombinase XerD
MAAMTDVAAPARRRSPITTSEYRIGQRPPNFGRTFPAEVLTPREVLELVNACARRGPSGLRNRALIVLMWRCGLRVSEALALFPKDVDLDQGTVTVLRGKGAKRRTVGIDAAAAAVVAVWLDCRRRIGIARSAPLFCTIARDDWGAPGRPMHTAYVRAMLKRLARRAGIDKRVHPHGLRHTHAYELMMEGVPLVVIKAQLGHESLATTDRYVSHLAPRHVVEAMREREWPEWPELISSAS